MNAYLMLPARAGLFSALQYMAYALYLARAAGAHARGQRLGQHGELGPRKTFFVLQVIMHVSAR